MSSRRSREARAVVTGAGSGIGRAFARELARRGSTILCADINVERAAETVALIEEQGRGRAEAIFCDVANVDDMRALAARAREFLGGPTSLMINTPASGSAGRRSVRSASTTGSGHSGSTCGGWSTARSPSCRNCANRGTAD